MRLAVFATALFVAAPALAQPLPRLRLIRRWLVKKAW